MTIWVNWFKRWFWSTNHKDISILYFIFGGFAGIIGTFLSVLIYWELCEPGNQLLLGNLHFNNVVAMQHALIAIFFTVMFVLISCYFNCMVISILGSSYKSLPRINNICFWLLPPSLLLFLISSFIETGIGIGWTLYPWLSSVYTYSGVAVDISIFFLYLVGVINFIIGLLNVAYRSILMFEFSLFVWFTLIISLLLLLLPLLGGVDILFHDTYYVGVYLYYVLSGGAVFGLFICYFFLIFKMISFVSHQILGNLYFLVFSISMNILFFPLYFLELVSMISRINDYRHDYLKNLQEFLIYSCLFYIVSPYIINMDVYLWMNFNPMSSHNIFIGRVRHLSNISLNDLKNYRFLYNKSVPQLINLAFNYNIKLPSKSRRKSDIVDVIYQHFICLKEIDISYMNQSFTVYVDSANRIEVGAWFSLMENGQEQLEKFLNSSVFKDLLNVIVNKEQISIESIYMVKGNQVWLCLKLSLLAATVLSLYVSYDVFDYYLRNRLIEAKQPLLNIIEELHLLNSNSVLPDWNLFDIATGIYIIQIGDIIKIGSIGITSNLINSNRLNSRLASHRSTYAMLLMVIQFNSSETTKLMEEMSRIFLKPYSIGKDINDYRLEQYKIPENMDIVEEFKSFFNKMGFSSQNLGVICPQENIDMYNKKVSNYFKK